ncbi:MAG: S1-like domain-containing RNA-binding protein [Spirochaetales bacterium]|nr:S1-like domain-containing RNA-binding protein [Spirochaetales bacterium]
MNENATPLQTGKKHKLTLAGTRGRFRILKKEDREILIPAYEVPETCKTGDTLEVFVFLDGKDGLKGTTAEAKAQIGDFASLKVKSVTAFGVFLDWGIKKDLFVPKALLRKDLEEGEDAIVCLIPDFDGVGVIGSCQIDEFLDSDTSRFKQGQKVDLLVFGVSELGFRVIVANRCQGLLYKNEVFEDLKIGDVRKGYIKKLRDDGKIDASLQPVGYRAASEDLGPRILSALKEAGGFLPLHDKSDPDLIRRKLNMSKKNFKKTVGLLYKEKKIILEEKGIRLTE